jgi:hypothetical protein
MVITAVIITMTARMVINKVLIEFVLINDERAVRECYRSFFVFITAAKP